MVEFITIEGGRNLVAKSGEQTKKAFEGFLFADALFNGAEEIGCSKSGRIQEDRWIKTGKAGSFRLQVGT
jgi:hypothetical protein